MKKLTLVLLALIIGHLLAASECYHYHTSKTHAIVKKESGIFYQFTEKDPNGISFVRQIYKQIKGIEVSSYQYAGEDETTFMFSDKNGFYQLPKDSQFEEKTAIYTRVLSASKVQKHINGRLFLIDNNWVYLSGWKDKVTKIVLKGLPLHLTNIKCYSTGLYLKSNQQVFSIYVDLYNQKPTIKVIPNLNPAQIIYYACNPAENEDYIADDQHIYSIRREGAFDDITPQFLALGVKRKFNELKLLSSPTAMWWSDRVIKKRDGHSVSGRNPLTGEEVDIYFSYSNATPLRPDYGKIDFIRFQNKIYPLWDDNFSTPYTVKTTASKLEAVEGGLFRGEDFYYMEADHMKIMNTNIPATARYFTGVDSYRAYLPKALVDDDYIHFIADRFDVNSANKTKLTNKFVKQLGLFYLFNNALFDGEKSYPVKADYGTLFSLGSLVTVINACAGSMPNATPTQVKYHQFFKDKNAVYYFNEKTKQLQVIQTANPTDFEMDNYEQLQELYKIKDVKGTFKKKAKQRLNYYAVAGGIIAVLGLSFLFLKRRRLLKKEQHEKRT